ncbi:ribonuclease HII [Butyrivibrio proteoclasticus]|uniref:ribonuclease HII n=1 Tax=Butyrivibrio proteoclasticus TaxID=43305 RepID=UPI000479C1DB|nr:ribonuclease HII [Butyrivibrio proteoclasticus]
MESIAFIKERLEEAVKVNNFEAFIREYQEDQRAGVQKLIATAAKKHEALLKEKERIETMKKYEKEYGDLGLLCGIDEVGRGPLAGPVYAAAVILPKDCDILYLNDSKKLSEKKREELYDVIMEKAVAVGIGHSSHTRIDEINILNATYEAMAMAVNSLSVKPDGLLIDAVHIPLLEEYKQVSIIKGDAKSVSIAAASIIAKVTRDRVMKELDTQYPEYGFASNKGYGSADHIAAIKKYGPCEIHRRSFIGNFV